MRDERGETEHACFMQLVPTARDQSPTVCTVELVQRPAIKVKNLSHNGFVKLVLFGVEICHPESQDLNGLARLSASNLRAE